MLQCCKNSTWTLSILAWVCSSLRSRGAVGGAAHSSWVTAPVHDTHVASRNVNFFHTAKGSCVRHRALGKNDTSGLSKRGAVGKTQVHSH